MSYAGGLRADKRPTVSIRIWLLMIPAAMAGAGHAQTPDRPESDPAGNRATQTQPATFPAEAPSAEVVLSELPEGAAPASEPTTRPVAPTDPQYSPRSTIREFLLAVTEAREKPERIRDAIACLDFGGLDPSEPEKAAQRAESLASLIDEVFRRTGRTSDDVPDESTAPVYTLIELSDPRKPELTYRLALALRDDGRWRFTPESIASLAPIAQLFREQTATQPADAKVESSVPAERRSARATMEGFLKAVNAKELNRAAAFLDLSDLDAASRDVIGRTRALRLKMVIDRIRPVVVQDISDRTDGDTYTFYVDEVGRIEIARQTSGSRKGEWLFTTLTVASIDRLFKSLEDKAQVVAPQVRLGFWDDPSLWVRSRVPADLKQEAVGLELWQWYGLALSMLSGLLVRLVLHRLLPTLVRPLLTVEGASVVPNVLRRRLLPVARLAMLIVWWSGVNMLDLPTRTFAYIIVPLRALIIIMGVWAAYNTIDLFVGNVAIRLSRRFPRLDDVLVPLLRKTLKVVLVLTGVVWVLWALGVEIGPILAGLGLGGLAFGLAAQDTLKNFFGSINVVLDRPFQVGDWVKIGSTEGQVESVGLRSTRIRTFGNSEVTIPNSDVMVSTIDNLGRRRFRRVHLLISLEYATPPERLEAFCEAVRELIRRHSHTRKEDFHVAVHTFAPSSIDVLLAAWLDVPDWASELRERHRLLLDILRVAEKLGVAFAFPTQTVHLRQSAAPAGATARLPQETQPLRITAADLDRIHFEGRTAAHAVMQDTSSGPDGAARR